MNPDQRDFILRATGARSLTPAGILQSLWSGYGSIDRYKLTGGKWPSVVVKHVRMPEQGRHPRGWNSRRSHQRKLRSYRVETAWYRHWADACDEYCRVPHCLAVEQHREELLMVLEDLDASGFDLRPEQVDGGDMQLCLSWLAHFHARFMGRSPEGLWPVGTYWHLDTRPDEWAAMEEGELKFLAGQLDARLNAAPFQTLVHGDAKLANFCFSCAGSAVAAVDFQYVGGGCGMKDVAYFIGSCLDEHECEIRQDALLDSYFHALASALARYRPDLDAARVEAAWRPLYALARTDFHRFLKGWSPGHWKIHSYSERLAGEVLKGFRSE